METSPIGTNRSTRIGKDRNRGKASITEERRYEGTEELGQGGRREGNMAILAQVVERSFVI